MRGKRYPKVFKIIAAKQKVNNGHSIPCLVARSSISTYCFFLGSKYMVRISSLTRSSKMLNLRSDGQAGY